MARMLLSLEQPEAWPTRLVSLLDGYHELFLSWEIAPEKVGAQAYDGAIRALSAALTSYSITGWHCTRLTDGEIAQIVGFGL